MNLNRKAGIRLLLVSGVLVGLSGFYIVPNFVSQSIAKSNSSNISDAELKEALISYEEKFSKNNYFGDVTSTPAIVSSAIGTYVNYNDEGKLGYHYKKGSVPILISAPHSLKQPPRPDNKSFKVADKWTGSIAEYIAEQTGAHLIYKTSYTNEDDNFKGYGINNPTKEDTRTVYRDKIEEVIEDNDIKLVIDLHGYSDSDSRDYGVIFGTNNGSNLLNDKGLLNEILFAFESNGYVEAGTKESKSVSKQFAYVVDGEYPAGKKNRTITNYVATSLKTPAIQIELSRTNRDPEQIKYVSKSINAIIDVINNVNEFKIGRTAEITKSSGVKLKSAAKSSSSDICSINKGRLVTILEDYSKNYYKVEYKNYTGYLKKSDVTRVAQVKGVSKHINFREKATIKSKIIAKINLNEYVKINKIVNDKFVEIEYGGRNGYVSSKFLTSINSDTVIKDSISQISYLNQKTVSTGSSNLVLRKGKSTKTDIITTIPSGKNVNIVDDSDSGWTKVAYKDYVGYVYNKYLI